MRYSCRLHTVLMVLLSTSLMAQSPSIDRKLFKSLCDGNTVNVRKLLDEGAHVDAREYPRGPTPLMRVAACTDLPTLRLLLDRGANVNAQGAGGESALTEALVGPSTTLDPDAVAQTVRVLIDRGANVRYAGLRGATPLMYAANNDLLLQSLNLLLTKGAQLEARDDFGQTALTFSANTGQPGAMRALLARGAQVNTQDSKGISPLMIAAETGNPETLKLLLAHGADPTAKDNSGRTAADYARTNHDLSPAAKGRVLALLRNYVHK